jgi:phospholipid-binding lipoprotein MlaA
MDMRRNHMEKVPSAFLIQLLYFSLFMGLFFSSPLLVLAQEKGEEDQAQEEIMDVISDPFEPLNRFFFEFNDKLYFYALKPIATGYKAVLPEPARVGVSDFFNNLAFPIRFSNCLLQGKGEGAAMEFARFIVNTFMGLGGFIDVASQEGFKKYDEDLGQTFGVWGVGPGFYICWPFLGPSSLRDTIGSVGDGFLDPVNYAFDEVIETLSVRAYYVINRTSLMLGDYESLKEAALDPYVSLKDAYYQNRKAKIKE